MMNRRITMALITLLQPVSALAVVPAAPTVVAGIDHIRPDDLDKVLREFCKANNCHVRRVASEDLWDIVTADNLRPVTIGDAPFFKPHRYFVETWGDKGTAYMDKERAAALKKVLMESGATLTPKDDGQ